MTDTSVNKRFCVLLALLILISAVFSGCGSSARTRVVHCDHCGKEVSVAEDSNITDDWILYCTDCEKELGLDTLIPQK